MKLRPAHFWIAVASVVVLVFALYGGSIVRFVGSFMPFEEQWRSPDNAARILVTDRKFGMRAVPAVIEFGDDALVALREHSADYTNLDNRSAQWVAEALSGVGTPTATAVGKELLARDTPRERLVGAVVLAAHGAFPDDPSARDLLVRAATQPGSFEGPSDDFAELALSALAYLPAETSLPVIGRVLSVRPSPYELHARACEALQTLNDPAGGAVLHECLSDSEFIALPEALRALLSLGDRDAIPLVISRIGPSIQGHNGGFVVRELEETTGRRYGFNRAAWQRWWDEHGATWTIPPERVGARVKRWR